MTCCCLIDLRLMSTVEVRPHHTRWLWLQRLQPTSTRESAAWSTPMRAVRHAAAPVCVTWTFYRTLLKIGRCVWLISLTVVVNQWLYFHVQRQEVYIGVQMVKPFKGTSAGKRNYVPQLCFAFSIFQECVIITLKRKKCVRMSECDCSISLW